MKTRKKYSIVINSNTMDVVLTKYNHHWVNYIQKIATCGIRIYDCTFNEAVYNLQRLIGNGYQLIKKR